MKKTNIVLIGMPGAGKSTIGVLLAKAMKMPFIDIDLLIQQKYNKYLQEIIDDVGVKEFLSIEEKAALELNVKNHVIATGGSMIYNNSALNHLKKDGVLVYLQLRYDEIESRIANISSRGIAMEKGQTLIGLYSERVPLYEKHADITVNCSGKDMEVIVTEIKNIFRNGE
ncbi:shikimate kinase [Acetivibrio straminisolvens]|jgi:shikimate kinase|uniref:Shikimate kinase n=1 Tax=Acetivibrio straminisolvens JCM 21531 TaxID=1294263 RepID=W4V5T0_9FIRM|nr:shikimate kinase [Acetivibrio straminisolvens]GAE88522.1 shikimate kinase I [Acetivibrio straminisolvens JCM 21531]